MNAAWFARIRPAIPLAVTIAGAGFIATLWLRAAFAMTTAVHAWVCLLAGVCYGIWIGLESRVSARELTKNGEDHDRGTMEVAALAKLALLVAALLPRSVPVFGLCLLGFPLMLAGIGLRLTAIARLGDSYSHRIRAPRLPLVTQGPYSWVRHPAYLGTLAAHAGLVFVLCNPWSVGALLLLWAPAVLLRATIEDRFLCGLTAYAHYREHVRFRLFPGIY